MSEGFSCFCFNKMVNVVSRSSVIAAVKRVRFFVFLSQGSFYKGSRSTQKGSHPHPEYGTGTTQGDSGNYAYQVSHTYPGGGGDDERLERGKAVRCLFFLLQGFHHVGEQAKRKQPGADGKVDSGRNEQQKHQGDAHRASHDRKGKQITP